MCVCAAWRKASIDRSKYLAHNRPFDLFPLLVKPPFPNDPDFVALCLIHGFQTNFGQGLYSGDELDSSLVKAKPAKVSGVPFESTYSTNSKCMFHMLLPFCHRPKVKSTLGIWSPRLSHCLTGCLIVFIIHGRHLQRGKFLPVHQNLRSLTSPLGAPPVPLSCSRSRTSIS